MTQLRAIHAAGLLLAVVALLGACSDDDDATATASSSAETTTAATELAATTTEPAATSTAVVTTTLAPTTTIDEIAATKQAIAAAAVQARQDYLYAVRNYDAPDAVEVLRRTHAEDGASLALGLRNMETLRSNGWRSRENPALPSTTTVEGDVELLDGPPATRAELTECTVDSGIVYEPGAAPDGSDVIVNDEITITRNRITMVLEDGAWKLLEGENLQSWTGGTTCPPA